MKGGANWFYFIAVASMVNSILHVIQGSDWTFFAGLGLGQLIDGIAVFAIKENPDLSGLWKVLALIFNFGVAAVCALFGFFAKKGRQWSFIAGMILVALDSFVFLLAADMIGFAFHLFAVFCIWGGYNSLKKLNVATLATGAPSAMDIHISRSGQQFGPYSAEQVKSYLADGSILLTDFGWTDGMTDWVPVMELPCVKVVQNSSTL
jgi:hypothetical protein